MSKKILITGGAGYIGTVLIPMLLEKNYDVVVVDRLIFKQNSPQYEKNFQFINDDVRNFPFMKKLLKEKKFDVVIPLAALLVLLFVHNIPRKQKKLIMKHVNF